MTIDRNTIEQYNEIQLTDKDEENGLDLFCYTKCTDKDSEIIKQSRGVVFEGDKVIMQAFPYTVEYDHLYDEQAITDKFKNIDDYTVFASEEGALIRMFYHKGKWYTSTHRKLNAWKSKWATNVSFGEYFEQALIQQMKDNDRLCTSIYGDTFGNILFQEKESNIISAFETVLDINKQYMFLVKHMDNNRIVCLSPDVPTLYHVGTFIEGKLTFDEDIQIPYPQRHTFANVETMLDYVNNIDIKYTQGVILFGQDGKQYKVLNTNYLYHFNIRGNEPSIKYRYLQLRKDKDMCNCLVFMYNHMREDFVKYESIIYDIVNRIYKNYIKRHITGEHLILPSEEHYIDKLCHAWHMINKKLNIVTVDKVYEILNNQQPSTINKMIRKVLYVNDQENKDQIPVDIA